MGKVIQTQRFRLWLHGRLTAAHAMPCIRAVFVIHKSAGICNYVSHRSRLTRTRCNNNIDGVRV